MELTNEIKEQIYQAIKKHSSSDCETVNIGNLIEIKINEDCLDIYKYAEQKDMEDEDYDFDEDYLCTVYF